MANVIELALQSLEDQQSTCYPFCNMHSLLLVHVQLFPPHFNLEMKWESFLM